MGVVSTTIYRTEPGGFETHMALALEAQGHLRRLGLRAVTLQPMAGGDVGTIATVVNHESHAAYAAAIQSVMGDQQWQEFMTRASGSGSASQMETAIFEDLDPEFQPPEDRPMGALLAVQWRVYPGRMADFQSNVMEAVSHVQRLGGAPRVMQSFLGAHPITIMFSTTFADMDAYGDYGDRTARDGEWQAFWEKVMTNPSAEAVRSGLYLNVGD